MTTSPDRVISQAELDAHSSSADCWLVIDGLVYNVSDFASKHPGGRRLTIMAGEDATSMVLGGHPPCIHSVLSRYSIGKIEECNTGTLPVMTQFLTDLNFRAREELKNEPTGKYDLDLILTLLLWALLWIAIYACGNVVLAVALGLCSCALVGMFAHEHAHGNISPDPERTPMGRFGAAAIWGIAFPAMPQPHFYLEHFRHHEAPMSGTKDYEVLALSPFLRLSEDIKWKPIHGRMSSLAPIIYGFYISIQFISAFFLPYFVRRRLSKDPSWHWELYAVPILSITFHILIPIYLLGIQYWLISFLLFNFSWQLATYLVAAVPHLTEHKLPQAASTWAEWVCHTTVNLHAGPLLQWLSGGFDYQIEHHLLPWVPRRHLPRVSRIVRFACESEGYPYRAYRSFASYLKDHRSTIKTWAQPQS